VTSLLRFRVVRHLLRVFANLPTRISLTWRYHGPRETLRRALLFPLRLTPLGPRLGLVTLVDPLERKGKAAPLGVDLEDHHVDRIAL